MVRWLRKSSKDVNNTWQHTHLKSRWLKIRTIHFCFNFCSKYRPRAYAVMCYCQLIDVLRWLFEPSHHTPVFYSFTIKRLYGFIRTDKNVKQFCWFRWTISELSSALYTSCKSQLDTFIISPSNRIQLFRSNGFFGQYNIGNISCQPHLNGPF